MDFQESYANYHPPSSSWIYRDINNPTNSHSHKFLNQMSTFKWLFVSGGALQSTRSEGSLQRWKVGEHRERREGRRGGADGAVPASRQSGQNRNLVPRNHTQWYRQVLSSHIPRLFRLFQPHVLDHLLAHKWRRSRRLGFPRRGLKTPPPRT